MSQKLIVFFLSILIIGDLSYSFLQYVSAPLDGDMAGGIVPAKEVEEIFEDPFGIFAISDNKSHANPNRYFAHLFFKEYYQSVPLVLQNVTSPINSVYYSNAIIKIFIHFFLIFIISAMVSGSIKFFSQPFLVSALVITPLFQAEGFYRYMGVIDMSVTYTFFYALPILLLLLFYYPFYNFFLQKRGTFNLYKKIILFPFVIIIPFSGPLTPPVVLIVSIITLYVFTKKCYTQNGYHQLLLNTVKSIPNEVLLFFIPISLLSLYSLFLGSYNSTYQTDILPVFDRYLRLPSGIYYQLTQKLGFPILLTMIALNIILLRRTKSNQKVKEMLSKFRWIGLFIMIYILLLPLGGYRPYRPNILRFDTILPVTICLFYIYVASSFFLINSLKNKKIYLLFIATVLLIFTNADRSNFRGNECEKIALRKISNSENNVVEIASNCKLLSWDLIENPEKSRLNGELLYLWNITDKKVIFYNKLNKQEARPSSSREE
ncbi:MAG TPA: hypothetical protein EYG86_08370 [Crocinitomicaceae bacterium]|nr:hypothetical protein [Crocinitomicaceae bacterium]